MSHSKKCRDERIRKICEHSMITFLLNLVTVYGFMFKFGTEEFIAKRMKTL